MHSLGPLTSRQTSIMENVFDLLQEATLHSLSATHDRISAANTWRDLARKHGHPSELLAMRETLNILDVAAAESSSLETLSLRLSDWRSFQGAQGNASDAAALAIDSRDLPLAVSLLEQGRSVIYSHLCRYRSAIDDVRRVSPELAARLFDLSVELDALVVRGERIDSNKNTRTKPSDDNVTR